jgi:hypothetical protein
MSGQFNLSYGGLKEWVDIIELSNKQNVRIDYKFLNEMVPPSNP